MDELKKLYADYTGTQAEEVRELPVLSGSDRRYFRLCGVKNLIGVYGKSAHENSAFIYLSGHLREKGLPVPAVYSYSNDKLFYLQEDLGDATLFDVIEHGRTSGDFNETERRLLFQSISLLPSFQVLGAEGLDFTKCYPQPAFDRRTVLWDLNYFKYCFLKTTGIDFIESRLEDDFQHMSDVLLQNRFTTFLYRDFQSRNVMIKDGEPYFIDFQGGRKGPIYYDVASFLWQAKANYPKSLRDELLNVYLNALRSYMAVDEADFHHRLRHFVFFRLLQVLGAYGFRGHFEHKTHFIESIPYAMSHLRELLVDDFDDYPYLCALLRAIKPFSVALKRSDLEVKIISFAYKKGIPADSNGNGGGFVFDCRALTNPGKYDQFKDLTGLDEPVIRFLEGDREVDAFMNQASLLVDASVKRYIERGFTNLMVCFGCTGGQHRSVYCAQRLAKHLQKTFRINISPFHRELLTINN